MPRCLLEVVLIQAIVSYNVITAAKESCWSVCQQSDIKNYWPDFHETCLKDISLAMEEPTHAVDLNHPLSFTVVTISR